MSNNDLIKRIARSIGPHQEERLRIGVLVSGHGSNLQALIDFAKLSKAHFKIVCVISNNGDGVALKRAKDAGIKNHFINHQAFAKRRDFELQLVEFLQEEKVELVVLAGFLRVLTPTFLSSFSGRIINLHPSLLPHFRGLHAIEQALCAGVDRIGCTVHLVDEGLDTGEIIAQSSCPLFPREKIDSVKEKMHGLEHELLPRIVNEIAAMKL